jgi:hypothetical protein
MAINELLIPATNLVQLNAVLQIRDGSEFFHPGSRVKRIPDPGSKGFRIPDPESKRFQILDPDPHQRI